MAVFEVETPNVGEAYVAEAAVASDGFTAFLRPARMTRLNGTQSLAGANWIYYPLTLLQHPRVANSKGSGGNVGGTFLAPA